MTARRPSGRAADRPPGGSVRNRALRPTTNDVAAGRLLASVIPPMQGATMAYSGQTISNPVSGERITFLQTAARHRRRAARVRARAHARRHVPGAHVHPEQEERFHVLAGQMKFRRGLRRIVAGPATPSSCPRAPSTGSPTPATRSPAAASRSSRRSTWSSCSRPPSSSRIEGNVTRKGMPKPLHLALFVGALPPRGPGAVPARVDGARPDGAARRDRAHARPRRALRTRRGLSPRVVSGAARGWCPIRSSKPAGGRSPVVGRFDSCAAPL